MLEHSESRDKPPAVLIVEDDPGHREILQEILRYEGFTILTSASAGEAAPIIDSEDLSVAILDLRLPDGPGTQVLRRIRDADDTVQVIMHTAHGSYASAKDSINLGAWAYLEKLGDPAELVRQVHRASQEKNRRSLYKSEESYHSLAESAPVGIFRTDAAGRYLYVNRRWCQITGLTTDEARGEGWADSLQPDQRERVLATWHNALAAGRDFSFECHVRRGDGVARVYVQASPETDGERLTGYAGALIDLSELG